MTSIAKRKTHLSVVTIRPTEHGPRWDHNTHRVILQGETPDAFTGWPDATDTRNSSHWNPATDKPVTYPKFAWEIMPPPGEIPAAKNRNSGS